MRWKRKWKLFAGWSLFAMVPIGGFLLGLYLAGGSVPIRQLLFLGIGLMSPFFGVTLTMVIVLGACEVIFGLNYLFSKLARGFRAIKKVTTKQGGGLR
ncbi:MAG: hypothetical protein AAB598_02080 [Patescibacteria group bacterium]